MTAGGSLTQGMNWIRPVKRLAIHLRDGGRCAYCRCDLTNAAPGQRQLDHLLPRAKGGSNDACNLVTACARCNNRKSDMSVHEFATPAQLRRIANLVNSELPMERAKKLLAAIKGR